MLVCDFGHGTIGRRTIDWLSTNAPFLAVNTQTNSANHGYNLVTKYPRADYVCIDEQELQLAHRTRSADVEELLDATARFARASCATVTLGSRGSLTWTKDHEAVRTPVLSTNVVDSVGAGVGETVLIAGGSSARQTEATQGKPVDHVIMAIVDSFDVAQAAIAQAEARC